MFDLIILGGGDSVIDNFLSDMFIIYKTLLWITQKVQRQTIVSFVIQELKFRIDLYSHHDQTMNLTTWLQKLLNILLNTNYL